jgi:hypothetical protein
LLLLLLLLLRLLLAVLAVLAVLLAPRWERRFTRAAPLALCVDGEAEEEEAAAAKAEEEEDGLLKGEDALVMDDSALLLLGAAKGDTEREARAVLFGEPGEAAAEGRGVGSRAEPVAPAANETSPENSTEGVTLSSSGDTMQEGDHTSGSPKCDRRRDRGSPDSWFTQGRGPDPDPAATLLQSPASMVFRLQATTTDFERVPGLVMRWAMPWVLPNLSLAVTLK